MRKKILIEILIVTIISRVIYTLFARGDFIKDIIVMALILGILAFIVGLIEFYVKSKK